MREIGLAFFRQLVLRSTPERDPAGDGKACPEGHNRRDAPVFTEGVYLNLFAHRPHLEKGKTGVDRKDHHRPNKQKKQDVCALQTSNGVPPLRTQCRLPVFHA